MSDVDLANDSLANDDDDDVHAGVIFDKALNDEDIEDPEQFD